MNVFNDTNDEVVYMLTSSDLEHSGTVEAGQTAEEPDFDNQEGVTATFYSTSPEGTFSIEIPESKDGMTVTIGIYFQ
jgi:hypothetical protein